MSADGGLQAGFRLARLAVLAWNHCRCQFDRAHRVMVGTKPSCRSSPGITSRSAFVIWPFPAAFGGFEIHFWSAMNASSCFATSFAMREASASTVDFLSLTPPAAAPTATEPMPRAAPGFLPLLDDRSNSKTVVL